MSHFGTPQFSAPCPLSFAIAQRLVAGELLLTFAFFTAFIRDVHGGWFDSAVHDHAHVVRDVDDLPRRG